MRRVLLVTRGCYLDSSNGASIASRAMMEAWARQGFAAEALSGLRFEHGWLRGVRPRLRFSVIAAIVSAGWLAGKCEPLLPRRSMITSVMPRGAACFCRALRLGERPTVPTSWRDVGAGVGVRVMRDGRVGNWKNARNVREMGIICENIPHNHNGAISRSLASCSLIRNGREITSRPALR